MSSPPTLKLCILEVKGSTPLSSTEVEKGGRREFEVIKKSTGVAIVQREKLRY